MCAKDGRAATSPPQSPPLSSSENGVLKHRSPSDPHSAMKSARSAGEGESTATNSEKVSRMNARRLRACPRAAL
jgi:hypothetical protein